jgi:hypothetical protein
MATSSTSTQAHVRLRRARTDNIYGSRYDGEPTILTSVHLPMGDGRRTLNLSHLTIRLNKLQHTNWVYRI